MIDTIKTLLRGIGRAGSYLVPYRSGGRLSTLGETICTRLGWHAISNT